MAFTPEQAVEKIKQRIADNPKLKNVNHVGISVHKQGFAFIAKKSIQFMGRVNKQAELDEINTIIEEEAKGHQVSNQLRVEYRS